MRDSEFQELIRRHPEVKPLFERVGGSYRAQTHWRLKAKWKLDRTVRLKGLLKSQIAFGEIAHGSFGKKGFDEEGKPIIASEIQEKMKGKTFKEKKKLPTWQEMLERVRRERLEALVRA